jgi:hypothetical protein
MEKELELLRAYVARTLNMANDQVAELVKTDDKESLKDNALDLLLAKDVQRVEKLKGSTDTTEIFNNGHKKGTTEALSKLEKEAMSHFEITTDAKGLDLITAIVEHKTKGIQAKQITPDEIKKSSTYLTALDKAKAEAANEVQAVTEQLTQEIQGYKKQASLVNVFNKADAIIDSQLKPIWSKDATRAATQRKQIHKLIGERNWDIKEDGKIVPLTADGKLLEDGHGNPVDFIELIKQDTTSLLDLHESKPRGSAGGVEDPPPGGKDGWNWNGQRPKNDDEFIKLVSKATSTEEKAAIRDSYNEE